MKKRISLLLALALIFATALGGCAKKSESAPQPTAQSVSRVEITSVRLEDDYYTYINQDVFNRTEIPENSDNWSYFYQLDREAYTVMDGILADAVQNRAQFRQGSLEQKIADLYLTARDMEGRRKAGFGALKPYLDGIRNAATIPEYLAATGLIYRDLGYSSLLAPSPQEDFRDSSQYACYLSRADLGPGKETLEDAAQADFLTQYQAYVQKIMAAFGLDAQTAASAAEDIVALQKDLAASALSLSEQNDPAKTSNCYSTAQLAGLFSGADIGVFLSSAGLDDRAEFVVKEEALCQKINTLLTPAHLQLLKNYSIFCLINDFSYLLTPEIRDIAMAWYNAQTGVLAKKSDEQLASEAAQALLRFEFGELYVKKCFSERDKLAVTDMVHRILTQYKWQINKLDWMGNATKAAAIKKLDTMTLKIGYPDKWPDNLAQVQITAPENGGSMIDNVVSIARADHFADMEKLRRPVDKAEWAMTPQTINAYYNPAGNEIVFPAAILQPPFYDPDAGFAVNLGGIGMAIAHEISHAFDSAGSLYDENGNYNSWWTGEDRAKFERLADRVVAYYGQQKILDGRPVNGVQTLDENIADLGALASITAIIGDDAAQLRLLFKQFATIWAYKITDERQIQLLNIDPHAPAKVRVNATLSSLDAFYAAYPEVKAGDGMYLPPAERVRIW